MDMSGCWQLWIWLNENTGNFRQQFSEDFFTCLCTHAHTPESFSRWTEHWKSCKGAGIKYSPLWRESKRRATQKKKIWFMKVWLFSILECRCHGNVVNGQVEEGMLKEGPLNGWKRKETFNLLLFLIFSSNFNPLWVEGMKVGFQKRGLSPPHKL